MIKKILFCASFFTILSFIGCNTNYDKGMKFVNDNKFKEAIEELNKVAPDESKYEVSREIIDNCHYKIAVEFIRNIQIDSAILELSKINKDSKIFTKSKSAKNYCDALNSIEYKNLKEAMSFLKDVTSESEFYLDAQKKLEEIEKKNQYTEVINKTDLIIDDYLVSIKYSGQKSHGYYILIKNRKNHETLYKSEDKFFFTPGEYFLSDLNNDGNKELIIYGSSGGNGGFVQIIVFDFKLNLFPIAELTSVGFNPKNDIYDSNGKLGIKIHYRKITSGLSMADTPIRNYTVYYENGRIVDPKK